MNICVEVQKRYHTNLSLQYGYVYINNDKIWPRQDDPVMKFQLIAHSHRFIFGQLMFEFSFTSLSLLFYRWPSHMGSAYFIQASTVRQSTPSLPWHACFSLACESSCHVF